MPVRQYPSHSPNDFQDERKWSYLIKLPGIRSGMRIPVTCQLQSCQHQLVTPRRVRVNAEIALSSPEVQVAQSDGPQIRWKIAPQAISPSSAVVDLSHVVNIPKDKAGILSIQHFSASVRVEQIVILRDRLVVKGSLTMQLQYSPRA